MKNKMVKAIGMLCVATMVMGTVVGCGNSSKDADNNTAQVEDSQTTGDSSEEVQGEGTEAEMEKDADGNVISTSMDAIHAEIEGQDAYMILEGIGASGGYAWAPTVLVLGNDQTFFAMVDYGGQAMVNFVTGEYVVNEDESITASGTLYNTGEQITYEIAKGEDGTYSTTLDIPDAGASATLTGTLK